MRRRTVLANVLCNRLAMPKREKFEAWHVAISGGQVSKLQVPTRPHPHHLSFSIDGSPHALSFKTCGFRTLCSLQENKCSNMTANFSNRTTTSGKRCFPKIPATQSQQSGQCSSLPVWKKPCTNENENWARGVWKLDAGKNLQTFGILMIYWLPRGVGSNEFSCSN